MEPFLLSIKHLPSGVTHVEYDIGPTKRAQMVVLTEQLHDTLTVPARDLLAHSLTAIRPPEGRRSAP